jgi:hypothetical protein
MTFMIRTALVAALALSLAGPVAAQQSVTQADIQRLEDSVSQAQREISRLPASDSTRVSRLRDELDDLRDEVIYLRVKLRKERTVTRAEYADVRDSIEDVRSRARGDAPPRSSSAQPAPPASTPAPASTRSPSQNTGSSNEVPSGTELDVRLQNSLNSGTAQVEDRFEGTTLVDLNVNGRVLIPAGSVMRGVVTSVEPGTRTNRTAKMTVSFDQVTVNGRAYPMRATVTEAIKGDGIKGELPRAGAGAAVGGIIGAVLGGAKGALLGVLIGGGGTIAATEGKEVELPQGTVLRVRVDAPLTIQNPR